MREFRKSGKIVCSLVGILIVGLLISGYIPAAFAQEKPFQGQTVRVVSIEPPFVSGPFIDYGPIWEKRTGAKVKLLTVPFAQLQEKIITALTAGIDAYDLLVFAPGWMADIAGPGHIHPVPKEVLEKLDWEDIMPVFRERLCTWGGRVYSIPYDGDFWIMHYVRSPLVEYGLTVPRTWNELREVAEKLVGKDWNENGKLDEYAYEMGAQRGGHAQMAIFTRAGAYAKYPGVPSYAFDVETMDALIDSPAWIQALTEMIEEFKYGPPDVINYGGRELRADWVKKRVAFVIEFKDEFKLSISPESLVKDDVGAAMVPGSPKVWNPSTQKWDWLPEINYAPFIAWGGWQLGVPKTTKYPQVAFDLAAFMSSKEMSLKLTTTPGTGVDAYRFSHLTNLSAWIEAGFSKGDTQGYLNAQLMLLQHPNYIPDLRISGISEYQSALEYSVHRAIAGEIAPEEALKSVAKEWNQITMRRGKEKQLTQYRASLGLPPLK